MGISEKIVAACAASGVSVAELARRLNTSPQAFGQRLKTERFSSADLDAIAAAIGARFVCSFILSDGSQI